MNQLQTLLDLVSPAAPAPAEGDSASIRGLLPEGKARRRALALFATGLALPLTALWGVAAGTVPGHIAVDNALEVPVLLVVSALAALPVGLFAVRLSSSATRGTEFVLAHSAAFFASAVVLALLAPIIGLFQHSSAWAGRAISIGSLVAGLAVGISILLRVLEKLVPDTATRRSMWMPVVVMISLEGAALAQVASISSPIFAERTAMGQGVDGLHRFHGARR